MNYNYQECTAKRVRRNASGRLIRTIAFFGVLLTLTIGLIAGAALSAAILAALPAVIVFGTVMLAVIIGLIIYRWYEAERGA